MAKYQAFIQDMRWPLGYCKEIKGKRIDAVNRAILQTGKAWPGLELPKAIKRGNYFSASFDGMQIQIYKDSL